MFTLRRWWVRHGIQVILAGLAIGSAWAIRETQGAALYETYQLLTRPFQIEPTSQERIENARFLELQERLVELESQNQKLKELLGYVKQKKQPGIVAPIAGRGADHWWQQITLGRGSQDGIKPDFIVMGTGGLVGRVTNVTPHSSRVLLVSDPSSRVGVVVSRSRYMGYLRGQGSNRAVMQFFDKVPDVRRGDVVATSSVSKLFPSGLPIGRIESVNLDKTPAPEAVIELTAPMSSLEWVVAYPK
ncbi:rod shape-determining protein MreC [Coleofasciculus sp. FACHB-1120]|uniref:rod shape-determining protein MreC n=1 Tax=Coleofasciculus sp. FACHB-1120 TaxID=2692783 RepID=UPI0016870F57|nr:rod shape-determining protein MreC [Coleofasciculus sp. FACHB-1120]MBD2741878.1 rod shape-determining protein MreC [Coleofasciculus sp. FACHB-1120]